jgi:glycosyltransferase involved in cell wall biosynthesis
MKLVYLAQIGLFDDWAHTVQIMKMCEAFAKNGVEVELVVPNRKVHNKNIDPFEYNHTEKVFNIKKLPFIDLFYTNPHPLFYWLRTSSFFISSRFYLLFKKYDILYTREIYSSLFFCKVYTELHSFPKNINLIKKFCLKKSKGLIVLTSFIKSKIVEVGVVENRVLVAHDGVRMEDFSKKFTKSDSRNKFGITQTDNIFGYVGTLKTMGMEKGVSTAIDALNFLEHKYRLYVVGGEQQHIDFYKKMAFEKGVLDRVIFAGRVLHETIPEHISTCDVLVAPFPKTDHYEYYMSPLKIFEYMASMVPMVVTNLSSLREVLKNNETALFVEPSDAKALAFAIERLVEDNGLSKRIAYNAYTEMEQKYTWNKRAETILNFSKI